MSDHPNLSPELNDLIRDLSDPSKSLNLREVRRGQILRVIFEESEGISTGFHLYVDKSYEDNPSGDIRSLQGRILHINLIKEELDKILGYARGEPKRGHEVMVMGSCTKNPGSIIGSTMIHTGHIDIGRSLLWQIGPFRIISWIPIESVSIQGTDADFKPPILRKWPDRNPDLLPDQNEHVPEKRLKEFYALTGTSVYCIREEKEKPLAPPIVEKVAMNGESLIALGRKPRDFRYVGITPKGLVFYNYTRRCPADEVDSDYFLSWSSSITALFRSRGEALQALMVKGRLPWDSRWFEESQEVLKAIGENHHRFVISKGIPIDW